MCVTSPAPDAVEVDDVEGADAVEFAVELRVSEAAIDCDDTADCAAAKLTKADTRKVFEKYMMAM